MAAFAAALRRLAQPAGGFQGYGWEESRHRPLQPDQCKRGLNSWFQGRFRHSSGDSFTHVELALPPAAVFGNTPYLQHARLGSNGLESYTDDLAGLAVRRKIHFHR